jgi:hypothetical protein
MRLAKLAARPHHPAKSADAEIDAMLDALFATELHPTWQNQAVKEDPSEETALTSAAYGADTARAA